MVTIIKYNDDYVIADNEQNIDLCIDEFNRVVKIIMPTGKRFRKNKEFEINSIKFLNLRKAGKKFKSKFFLTKDRYQFATWIKNPINMWDKIWEEFIGRHTIFGGTLLRIFSLNSFKRITGINKLKIKDIYEFKGVEIRLK